MHISCTICTELYQASEETGITKCGHLFHMNCITPWLQKHKTCPHCRANTSVCDLIRVFFTEISSENVHLDRNCKIDSLEAIAASEKEHIKKIQIDLKQAKNDLIDMNKHIERYEIEIKNLKILNESLSENNTKIESDNKKLIEKISISEINRNSPDLDNYKDFGINFNENENDIIELKTIIESYEEANNRSMTEIELLQKQLNIELLQKEILMTRNGQLEHELRNLNEEIRKYQMSFSKTKSDEHKGNVNVITRKKLRNELYGLNIKKHGTRHDNNPLENLRQEKILTKSSAITKIGNNETELATSNMNRNKSFRKRREEIAKLKSCPMSDTAKISQSELNGANCVQNYEKKQSVGLEVKTLMKDKYNEIINLDGFNEAKLRIMRGGLSLREAIVDYAKLKLCPLSDIDNSQQVELRDGKKNYQNSGLKLNTLKEDEHKIENVSTKTKKKDENINNNKIIDRESPTLKYTRSESFQKTRDKFTLFDHSDDKHLNRTAIVNGLKEQKQIRSPMPPPRTLKLLPLTIRPPCPPPRTRTDKSTELDSNINLRIPQHTTQTRIPVSEHPLAIDAVIRKPPTGSIPLLGLCKMEPLDYGNILEAIFDNFDTSVSEEENLCGNKGEEDQKVTLNESNA